MFCSAISFDRSLIKDYLLTYLYNNFSNFYLAREVNNIHFFVSFAAAAFSAVEKFFVH